MQEGIITRKFIEVCGEWLEEQDWLSVRGKLGIFSSAAVVWLGIQQRLTGNSLQSALSEMVKEIQARKEFIFIKQASKKIKKGDISSNTGGVSRAKKRISLGSIKELFNMSADEMLPPSAVESKRIYVLDGTNLTISRTKDNLTNFCSTGNGQGELHFPKIRSVGIHDLKTGIARRVAIGDWKSSEVGLARESLSELEPGSLIIGDRFYAKPVFIDACRTAGINLLVRLKDCMGEKLLGKCKSPNKEKIVAWEAKTAQGKNVQIRGKIVKFTSKIKGFRSSEFYFFTTDENLGLKEIADLYFKRVRVEVFIRDVKQTLKMFFIKSKTADNIKKEIYLAYLTFNLVRSVMDDTARIAKIEPDRLSFTGTIRICQAYDEAFLLVKDDKDLKRVLKNFRTNLLQTKLPNRKNKHRSYPRVVKYGKDRYPVSGIVRKTKGVSADEGK
jgi:hypothetical protein